MSVVIALDSDAILIGDASYGLSVAALVPDYPVPNRLACPHRPHSPWQRGWDII